MIEAGSVHKLVFQVPREKTVPFLYPESPDFAAMPEVFATGFMVGLIEWCCMEALRPHLEPGQGSLGTAISVTHVAATPVGGQVTVEVTCRSVEGRKVTFAVVARDDLDLIGEGTHDRALVSWDRFVPKVAAKQQTILAKQR